MDEPDFKRIDSAIEEIQSKLTALGTHERLEGILRLEQLFKRRGVALHATDKRALESWAASNITTADLLSQLSPKLRELDGALHGEN